MEKTVDCNRSQPTFYFHDFNGMSYFSYVLKSIQNGRHYYGSCSDLQLRLKNHNSGKVRSTKGYRPYEVVFFEEFESRSEAFARERFYKTIEGYKFLRSIKVI